MTGTIRFIKIANYRSIDSLELHNIKPFSVFAGPNGAGKTNFFEALDFVNCVIQFSAIHAIKKYGGFNNIRCLTRNPDDASVFKFELVLELKTETQQTEVLTYHLEIHQLDSAPRLKESLLKESPENGKQEWTSDNIFKDKANQGAFLRSGQSFLSILFHNFSEIHLFNSLRLYQIEPKEAKLPIKNYDDSELNYNGRNLAAVLNRLEKNDEMRETILEWMELMVPGLENVQSQSERLTGSSVLTFKEEGVKDVFPAHLISDGTIYLLSILVALLDRPSLGMTLIEEPERGLHPKAIMELVDAFRKQATDKHPIWVTTHNEALVRHLKNHELWLVDKKQGQTTMKNVTITDKLASSLDQAWLTNALDGGLPW